LSTAWYRLVAVGRGGDLGGEPVRGAVPRTATGPERRDAAGQAGAPRAAGGAVHSDDALLATGIYARDRRHLLSLAGRCCLATAMRLRLPAVTGDRAWATLDLEVEVVAFR
jgi:PIN domain nuclease of toxin-antitoxin system